MKVNSAAAVFVLLYFLSFIGHLSAHWHNAYFAYEEDFEGTKKNARWMEKLSNDRRLFNISIPGTHDSGALWGGVMVACQILDFTRQLEVGIRFFDIRCRHIENVFTIHHGAFYQHIQFGDVLDQVVKFLKANPTEFVLMRVTDEYTPSECYHCCGCKCTRNMYATFVDYLELSWVKNHTWVPSSAVDGINGKYNPKVSEIRGKMIFLQDFNEDETYGIYYKPSERKQLFDQQNDYELAWNWDLYWKWERVRSQIWNASSYNEDRTKMFINFLSASNHIGAVFPYFAASGHLGRGTGASRLATGWFERPGTLGIYPEFPRVFCVFVPIFFTTLCTIAFEGTNIMTYDYLKKHVNITYVGVIVADFPGIGLIDMVISVNDRHPTI